MIETILGPDEIKFYSRTSTGDDEKWGEISSAGRDTSLGRAEKKYSPVLVVELQLYGVAYRGDSKIERGLSFRVQEAERNRDIVEQERALLTGTEYFFKNEGENTQPTAATRR